MSNGYGIEHQRLRAQLVPVVATGTVRCWRCGDLIPAGSRWDLGHDDEDRSLYRGPEHVRCNRRTGGRRGGRRRRVPRRQSRRW